MTVLRVLGGICLFEQVNNVYFLEIQLKPIY